MFFAALLPLLSLASAAPIVEKKALLPDLPQQADLSSASATLVDFLGKASCRDQQQGQYNDCGRAFQNIVPIANTLDSTIGEPQVLAIDILADRLCIAGRNQGSLCSELIGYAYSWYVLQQNGKTYKELAQILGANNLKTLNNDLNVLCVGNEQYNTGINLCQMVAEDVDVLANSLIGEGDLSEDNNNSNSLEYFGLSNLLPAPQALGL